MKPGYYISIMIAPVIITVILMIKWKGMPEGWRSSFLRIAWFALLVFAAFHLPGFRPSDSGTEPPWTFPCLAASIIVALFFVRSNLIAIAAASLWFLLFVINWPLFNSIFRARNLTLNPWYTEVKARRQYDAILLGVLSANDGKTHPPEFVDNLGSDSKDALELWTAKQPLLEYRFQREWYTPFTGIVHETCRPARIWFKGGSFDQGESAFVLVGQGEFK